MRRQSSPRTQHMHQYHAGAAAAVAVAWTWRLERAQRAGWRGRRDGEETVTERAPMGPGGHALHASCRAVAGWLVQWARVGSAMHACMFDRSAAPLRTTQLASLPLFPNAILRRAVEGRTANAAMCPCHRPRPDLLYLFNHRPPASQPHSPSGAQPICTTSFHIVSSSAPANCRKTILPPRIDLSYCLAIIVN